MELFRQGFLSLASSVHHRSGESWWKIYLSSSRHEMVVHLVILRYRCVLFDFSWSILKLAFSTEICLIHELSSALCSYHLWYCPSTASYQLAAYLFCYGLLRCCRVFHVRHPRSRIQPVAMSWRVRMTCWFLDTPPTAVVMWSKGHKLH